MSVQTIEDDFNFNAHDGIFRFNVGGRMRAVAGFEHITERKNCKLAKRVFALTGYYFANDTTDMKVGDWNLQRDSGFVE